MTATTVHSLSLASDHVAKTITAVEVGCAHVSVNSPTKYMPPEERNHTKNYITYFRYLKPIFSTFAIYISLFDTLKGCCSSLGKIHCTDIYRPKNVIHVKRFCRVSPDPNVYFMHAGFVLGTSLSMLNYDKRTASARRRTCQQGQTDTTVLCKVHRVPLFASTSSKVIFITMSIFLPISEIQSRESRNDAGIASNEFERDTEYLQGCDLMRLRPE